MALGRFARSASPIAGLAAVFLAVAAPVQAEPSKAQGRIAHAAVPGACLLAVRRAEPQHHPPLAFPSCNPPAETSGQATVGSPDAFGGAANFTGYFLITVRVGTPGPPDDSDVYVKMDLTDVRCVPTGASCGAANDVGPADYSGEIGFRTESDSPTTGTPWPPVAAPIPQRCSTNNHA